MFCVSVLVLFFLWDNGIQRETQEEVKDERTGCDHRNRGERSPAVPERKASLPKCDFFEIELISSKRNLMEHFVGWTPWKTAS